MKIAIRNDNLILLYPAIFIIACFNIFIYNYNKFFKLCWADVSRDGCCQLYGISELYKCFITLVKRSRLITLDNDLSITSFFKPRDISYRIAVTNAYIYAFSFMSTTPLYKPSLVISYKIVFYLMLCFYGALTCQFTHGRSGGSYSLFVTLPGGC
jgi:hypothetical protein